MKVKCGDPKWGQRLARGRGLHGGKEATEGPRESSGLGARVRLLSRGWLLREERAAGLEPLRAWLVSRVNLRGNSRYPEGKGRSASRTDKIQGAQLQVNFK